MRWMGLLIILLTTSGFSAQSGIVSSGEESSSDRLTSHKRQRVAPVVKGACVYSSDGNQQCKFTTQDDCVQTYNGKWYEGQTCSQAGTPETKS